MGEGITEDDLIQSQIQTLNLTIQIQHQHERNYRSHYGLYNTPHKNDKKHKQNT